MLMARQHGHHFGHPCSRPMNKRCSRAVLHGCQKMTPEFMSHEQPVFTGRVTWVSFFDTRVHVPWTRPMNEGSVYRPVVWTGLGLIFCNSNNRLCEDKLEFLLFLQWFIAGHLLLMMMVMVLSGCQFVQCLTQVYLHQQITTQHRACVLQCLVSVVTLRHCFWVVLVDMLQD